MKYVIVALALGLATAAEARLPKADYPSCAVTQQRALKAPTGGQIKDPRQAHISMRVNILQADIGNARKARRISAANADRWFRQLSAIRAQSDRLVRKQGFLSAAERASYDRTLDAVALQLCG